MHCYLYFAYWNPLELLPEVLQEAVTAFNSGRMVMVVFGISADYADMLPELKLRYELPIDWLLVDERNRDDLRSIIQARLHRFADSDRVTVLKWDEKWLGISLEDVK